MLLFIYYFIVSLSVRRNAFCDIFFRLSHFTLKLLNAIAMYRNRLIIVFNKYLWTHLSISIYTLYCYATAVIASQLIQCVYSFHNPNHNGNNNNKRFYSFASSIVHIKSLNSIWHMHGQKKNSTTSDRAFFFMSGVDWSMSI